MIGGRLCEMKRGNSRSYRNAFFISHSRVCDWGARVPEDVEHYYSAVVTAPLSQRHCGAQVPEDVELKNLDAMEALEDLDDVDAVFTNMA